MRICAIALTTP